MSPTFRSQLIAELVLGDSGENRSKPRQIEALSKFQTLSILLLITSFQHHGTEVANIIIRIPV